MRALFDAVVVGAETVRHDDPQLTVRLVPGRNPTRVVLDPRRRLKAGYRLFTDGAAPTLVLCADELAGRRPRLGQAEVIGVGAEAGRLRPAAVLDLLAPARAAARVRRRRRHHGVALPRRRLPAPPADHDRAADHRLGPPEHLVAEDRAPERGPAPDGAQIRSGRGTSCSNAGSMAEARAFWTVAPGQGELRSERLPDPGPDEILVEALASGISRGTETHGISGARARRASIG